MSENEEKKPSKISLLKLYAVTEAAIKVMEDSIAEDDQKQEYMKDQESLSQNL